MQKQRYLVPIFLLLLLNIILCDSRKSIVKISGFREINKHSYNDDDSQLRVKGPLNNIIGESSSNNRLKNVLRHAIQPPSLPTAFLEAPKLSISNPFKGLGEGREEPRKEATCIVCDEVCDERIESNRRRLIIANPISCRILFSHLRQPSPSLRLQASFKVHGGNDLRCDIPFHSADHNAPREHHEDHPAVTVITE